MKGLTSSTTNQRQRRRWRCAVLAPMTIALVVLADIFLLGGLDLGNSSYFSLSDTFHGNRFADVHTCENWLERQDNVAYSRDFHTDPVLVSSNEQQVCSNVSFGFETFFLSTFFVCSFYYNTPVYFSYYP
jgi:hypothetical protein